MNDSSLGENPSTDATVAPGSRPDPAAETGNTAPTPTPEQALVESPPPDGSATVGTVPQHGSSQGDGGRAGTVRPEPELPRVAGYEILARLGRGGMGVVYKARQQGLKRTVALKMILAGGHASDGDLARFRSEAEAVARFQHPNIVQVFEVGEEDGRPYFSLEFVDGGSLDRKIAGTPQPAQEAARLVYTLAGAMACAHRHGVIHRDLKPANVLLTADGTPKISDFGLAKRLDEESGATQSGSLLGTPSYMAPEQAAGRVKEIGPLADVYALGAILYELLTGRPPFRGSSLLDTVQLVQFQEPVSPSQFQPKLPRDLETICLKCLQKEPRKRYAGAAELAEDLRRFLAGEPILARPVSAAERWWRWCKRNPWTALLGGAVAVLVLTVAVVSTTLALLVMAERDRADANAAREAKARRLADQRSELLLNQFAESAKDLLGLVEKLEKKLNENAAVGRDPKLRALRQDLLATARTSLVKMAGRLQKEGVTHFSLARFHQEMGDLFERLGRRKEALDQFGQAYKLVVARVKEDPEDDKARANQARLAARLADITLGHTGDARAARERYREAVRLQEEVYRHPRRNPYSAFDNWRLLDEYHFKLGQTYLVLGDAAAARDSFLKSLEFRLKKAGQEPKNVSFQSYLAETYMFLGDASWRLRDFEAVQEYFGRALAICDSLLGQKPDAPGWLIDRVVVTQGYAEALARLGRPSLALPLCRKGVAILEGLQPKARGNTGFLLLLARLYYQRGTLLAQLNQPEPAEADFRKALQLRESLARADRPAYLESLARAGRHAEAARLVEEWLKQNPLRTEAPLQAARVYALCAGGPAEPSLGRQYRGRALELLRKGLGEDFRNAFVLETDPDLHPLRQDPGFQEILKGLRKPRSR